MLRAVCVCLLALTVLFGFADSVECWQERPGSQLVPTTFKDCRSVIRWLSTFDRASSPMIFSRRQGAGYLVPAQWISGNCILAIDMISDDVEDFLSFQDIAVEAYTVALACVITPPRR